MAVWSGATGKNEAAELPPPQTQQGETIVTASTPVLTKSCRRYLNGKKLCENWKLFWEMPLQVAEAKPWFGQPPLSRAKDQNDSRVT